MNWRRRHRTAYVWGCTLTGAAVGWAVGWFAARAPWPWGLLVILVVVVAGLIFSVRTLRATRRGLHAVAMVSHAIEEQDADLLEAAYLELAYLSSPSQRRLRRRRTTPRV